MAGGAELAELAHELEQLGGHTDALKEVQAEVADVHDTTDNNDVAEPGPTPAQGNAGQQGAA
jgi:simple sugar transport system ATP-binding protein